MDLTHLAYIKLKPFIKQTTFATADLTKCAESLIRSLCRWIAKTAKSTANVLKMFSAQTLQKVAETLISCVEGVQSYLSPLTSQLGLLGKLLSCTGKRAKYDALVQEYKSKLEIIERDLCEFVALVASETANVDDIDSLLACGEALLVVCDNAKEAIHQAHEKFQMGFEKLKKADRSSRIDFSVQYGVCKVIVNSAAGGLLSGTTGAVVGATVCSAAGPVGVLLGAFVGGTASAIVGVGSGAAIGTAETFAVNEIVRIVQNEVQMAALNQADMLTANAQSNLENLKRLRIEVLIQQIVSGKEEQHVENDEGIRKRNQDLEDRNRLLEARHQRMLALLRSISETPTTSTE